MKVFRLIINSEYFKVTMIVLIICGIFTFGAYLFNSSIAMNGEPIPAGVNIIYKKTEYRGALNILRYEAFDTNGIMYYITADNFKTLQVPQLVGQGLYLMPDGKEVTSIGGTQ